MKNLPENDFWRAVKGRLENYAEAPDDDSWDKIAGALPRGGSSWGKQIAGVVLIFVAGSFAGYMMHKYSPLEGANASLNGIISDSKSLAHDQVSDSSNDALETTNGNNDESAPTLSEPQPSQTNDAASNQSDKSQLPTSQSPSPLTKNGTPTRHAKTSGLHGHENKQGASSTERVEQFSSETTEEKLFTVSLNDGRSTNDEQSQVTFQATGVEKTKSNNVRDGVSQSNTTTVLPEDIKELEKDSVEAVSAKKGEQPKKKKRIFHADVYATLTPSLSFQKISPSGDDDISVVGLQSEGIMSTDRFGISFEGGFQRKLSPKFEWYGGFTFYHQKQSLSYEYNTSTMTVQYANDGGYTLTPVTAVKEFDYNMTNVGIASGVFYHLAGEKLMHKIGGGLQFQKGLLTTSGEGTYNNSRSTYFNYQLSYRLECQLNKKLNVYLQPTFIHAIIANEELTEPFDIKPYKAGIGIGMVYHF